MADYKVQLTRKAMKQLDKMEARVTETLLSEIDKLATDPRPQHCKKLKGRDAYRLRKGDYRIIYEIFDEYLLIDVITVGHRKDIYR